MNNIPDKYNTEWFQNRALNFLKQIEPHVWDYSDSLLLYISNNGVEEYETLQDQSSPYFTLVTEPERTYLQLISADIAKLLPSDFEYIDLGPGTEHKEKFLFDELKKLHKKFTYIPVDISLHYLELAQKHACAQDIPVIPLQASFEELPEILHKTNKSRFVSLGLTFSNYEPQTILNLLEEISGNNGYIFINTQVRDRVDMASLKIVYGKDAVHLADDKLRLLGLDPNTDVTPREADDQIKVWCTIINPSKILQEKGVAAGDKFLVYESLRYTKDSLISELKKRNEDFQIFDSGSSFIGSLIKNLK